MRSFNAVVVGAGPAGMSAAIGLRAQGLSVLVVDEQPTPGGQIWRAVEAVAPTTTGALLGKEYLAGADLASRFRSCGASYEPETRVWQVEPPRVLRRLQHLRRWSHEQITEVLPGSARARRAHGAGAPSRLPVAVGSD
ncbi:FAD-dependent oxidoreductase [Alicycliphilus denitrificans]|uniref:FAD-dependent oxidoreductase n=1 Tax=Alicycliphilus denitrificans TaxID=179636 RepID=UPI0009DAAB7A|nr:FAD-dependent oxidoreductase [Alicycliphilus denitrificans]